MIMRSLLLYHVYSLPLSTGGSKQSSTLMPLLGNDTAGAVQVPPESSSFLTTHSAFISTSSLTTLPIIHSTSTLNQAHSTTGHSIEPTGFISSNPVSISSSKSSVNAASSQTITTSTSTTDFFNFPGVTSIIAPFAEPTSTQAIKTSSINVAELLPGNAPSFSSSSSQFSKISSTPPTFNDALTFNVNTTIIPSGSVGTSNNLNKASATSSATVGLKTALESITTTSFRPTSTANLSAENQFGNNTLSGNFLPSSNLSKSVSLASIKVSATIFQSQSTSSLNSVAQISAPTPSPVSGSEPVQGNKEPLVSAPATPHNVLPQDNVIQNQPNSALLLQAQPIARFQNSQNDINQSESQISGSSFDPAQPPSGSAPTTGDTSSEAQSSSRQTGIYVGSAIGIALLAISAFIAMRYSNQRTSKAMNNSHDENVSKKCFVEIGKCDNSNSELSHSLSSETLHSVFTKTDFFPLSPVNESENSIFGPKDGHLDQTHNSLYSDVRGDDTQNLISTEENYLDQSNENDRAAAMYSIDQNAGQSVCDRPESSDAALAVAAAASLAATQESLPDSFLKYDSMLFSDVSSNMSE